MLDSNIFKKIRLHDHRRSSEKGEPRKKTTKIRDIGWWFGKREKNAFEIKILCEKNMSAISFVLIVLLFMYHIRNGSCYNGKITGKNLRCNSVPHLCWWHFPHLFRFFSPPSFDSWPTKFVFVTVWHFSVTKNEHGGDPP